MTTTMMTLGYTITNDNNVNIASIVYVNISEIQHTSSIINSAIDQNCYYADPFKQQCKKHEINATLFDQPTNLGMCISPCFTTDDCPKTPLCPGVVSKPKCFLQDQFGNMYCGLPCMKKGIECSYDEHMVCADDGVCGYTS